MFFFPRCLGLWVTVTMGFWAVACASTPEPDKTVPGELELARQFISAGEYTKAISTLHSLRRNNAKNAEVEAYLGLAYMGFGDFRAAAESLKRAISLDGSNLGAKLNYGYSLIVLKKYEDARMEFDEIIETGSFNYMEKVYGNYGLSYLEQNRCDLAQGKFNEALRLDPTFVTAHFNSGKCHMKQKKFGEAIKSFSKAKDFCPGCVDPVWELSKAYYYAGQKKVARESLEELLRKKLDRVSEVKTRDLLREFKR